LGRGQQEEVEGGLQGLQAWLLFRNGEVENQAVKLAERENKQDSASERNQSISTDLLTSGFSLVYVGASLYPPLLFSSFIFRWFPSWYISSRSCKRQRTSGHRASPELLSSDWLSCLPLERISERGEMTCPDWPVPNACQPVKDGVDSTRCRWS
jgi:hypothetical protein